MAIPDQLKAQFKRSVNFREEVDEVFNLISEVFEDGNKGALRAASEYYAAKLNDTTEDMPLLRSDELVEVVGEEPKGIAEMIPANSFLAVCGRPKHGKSFFMLQMAEDIATGRPLFGRWDVEKPGPVIYFALEDGKYGIRRRVKQRGMHERKARVYFYYLRNHEFSTPAGVQWMLQKVQDVTERDAPPVLIVIDTARTGLHIDDWNRAGEVARKLQPLQDACQTLPEGCSIILVCHNNKNPHAEGGDKISGSNALQSTVDGYLILDNKKRLPSGDLMVEVECEGRVDMPDKFTWVMDTETLHVQAIDDTQADAMRAAARSETSEKQFDRIERALLAHDREATVEDIVAHTGVGETYIRRTVKKMVDSGRLVFVGNKKTGTGRGKSAPTYTLPAPEEDRVFNNTSLYRVPQLKNEGGGVTKMDIRNGTSEPAFAE